MRLLDTDIRFIDQNSYKAPKNSNAWGATIDILDYCLVNGSPSQAILTINTVEDPEDPENYWISTLLLNEGHRFEKDLSVVEISGCTDSVYNTLHRVQKSSENTISIAFDKKFISIKPLDSNPVDDMKIKLAPLGYEKVFEGINKAAYKSKIDLENMFLRVDNSCPSGFDLTWTKFSRVSIISDMTSIDDYKYRHGRVKVPQILEDYSQAEESRGSGTSGIYGSSKWYQRLRGSGWLYETTVTTEGSLPWNLIGDNQTFYFLPEVYESLVGRGGYCFGKYHTLNPSSTKNYILCCAFKYSPAGDNFGYSWSNPGHLESVNSFTRLNTYPGNLLMNSVSSSTLLQGTSEQFELSCSVAKAGSNSADASTEVLLDPFKFYISFLPLHLKSNSKIFKGSMRGYYFILNNAEELARIGIPLSSKRVVENITYNSKDSFIILEGPKNRGGSMINNTFIAFKLNNWGD